ncbi:ABC transporter permease [Kibdelosporangium aridum]|uniref:Putative ABC transport system permease protein n=1 Tax=Kibdelosporangium aridum TaxID=2030 RepID=A0A1Y5XUQ7_KIBAR|nr:ABC transporter permease [Kibdelosporangium aridum]SMD18376.1 putative ABC transport system permease protein [Kibdelosporangium aridum]
MIRLSGRFRSAVIIGGQGIRARKLRTFLSMLSLFLGVLAVVIVQAGSEFAQRQVLAESELNMAKDGTLQIYLPPHEKAAPVTLETLRGRSEAVAMIDNRAIIGEPGVAPVNPGGGPFDQPGGGRFMRCDNQGNCYDGSQTDAPPGRAIELTVVALTGDIRPFRAFRQESGQWLDFASAPSLAPRLVLNKEAAKGFERHRVPAQMHMDGAAADATPQIIGVVNDGSGYGPMAYVRADELLNWLPTNALSGNNMRLQVFMSPEAHDLEQTLKARLIASGMPGDQIYVQSVKSRERVEDQLALMRLIFLGMAGLVLLIGTAGILNVGLATVGERIEEFALRRAVGTPRILLAGIVLAETLLVGLMTAAAAIGVGAAGIKVGASMFGNRFASLEDLSFPWQAGVAGVIAGLIAGLLGGLIPAIRAARIPIATVMRA